MGFLVLGLRVLGQGLTKNEETHARWILRNLYTLFRLWANIDELPTIVATQAQEDFEGDFEGDFKGSSSGSFRCTQSQ